MKNTSSLYFFLFVLLISFGACSSDTSSNKEAVLTLEDSSALVNSIVTTPVPVVGKFDMVISDIPFPFEILDNLYDKKIAFDKKAMNEVANAAKYNQYNSKALNLGVYGADLAYSVTYEQFPEMGNYIKTTKHLAEELNIPYAFDQSMMDKYSKFKDNKDSLTQIVYESYNQVDKALKGDERVGMAALVVAGSWLEGLYISTKTFSNAPKTADNTSLYKTISGQKASLVIVVKLLEEYPDDAFIASLIADFKTITSEYKDVKSEKALDEKQLLTIHSKVEALRNKIIAGQ